MKCSLIVVQSLRHVRLYDPMASSMPGFPVHHISLSLLKLMSIELVMPSNHLTLWHLLLFSLIFHSIRIYSNVLALCIRWLKCWSFSISLSSEYSRLVSFRIDWFDLLAVQGTLKFAFSGTFYAFFVDSSLTFYLLPSFSIQTLRRSVLFFSERCPRLDTPGSSVRSAVWTSGLCRLWAVKAAMQLQAQLHVRGPFSSQRNVWITQQVSIQCLKRCQLGAYYTEWSKPERKTPIQYTNAYIWNLERW